MVGWGCWGWWWWGWGERTGGCTLWGKGDDMSGDFRFMGEDRDRDTDQGVTDAISAASSSSSSSSSSSRCHLSRLWGRGRVGDVSGLE